MLTGSNRFSGGNDHDYDSDLYANGDPISVASSSNYHSRWDTYTILLKLFFFAL